MSALWTEAEAWRAIGAELEKAKRINSGLCAEVSALLGYGIRNSRLLRAMFKRIDDHLIAARGESAAFAYREGTHWEARCLAAYWMALEAESEQ